MQWFKKVKAGDKLRPHPDWNRTERQGNRLPDPVEVLRVLEEPSQSGVLFAVRTLNGRERNLDAAWFRAPAGSQKGGRHE